MEIILNSFERLDEEAFEIVASNMAMKELPALLSNRFDRKFIKIFFNRQPAEDEDQDQITGNLEQNLVNSLLPKFSTCERGTFVVDKFWDFRNFRQELVMKVKEFMTPLTLNYSN